MKQILLTITLLIAFFTLSAQDSTENVGRIYGEFRSPSFLAEQLDTNFYCGSGTWMLSEYKLYDSTNTLVYNSIIWIGGGYSSATSFDIPNLKLGKYVMKYNGFRKGFSDTIILTKKEPVIKRTLYQAEDNTDLKLKPTIIELLENGDTMRISSVIITMSGGTQHLMIIAKENNQYFLELQSDKTYSKVLTDKDIYAIKCFEWDTRRTLSGRNCNDAGAIYTIEYDSYKQKKYDNCDEWGGFLILKHILFEQ